MEAPEPLEVRVLFASGELVTSMTASPGMTVKDLKSHLLPELDGAISSRQLKIICGSRSCKDTEEIACLFSESPHCISLTLVICAPPVSIARSFQHFDADWSVVETGDADPHATYLYDPRAQQVIQQGNGTVVLSSRGRVATRREVALSKDSGALRIRGKFMYTGSSEDFLTIIYGVRALHTGALPYGSLDDQDRSICISLMQGSVHCRMPDTEANERERAIYELGDLVRQPVDTAAMTAELRPLLVKLPTGQESPMGNFWFPLNTECCFCVTIDPEEDFVSVDLESQCCECSLARRVPGIASLEFPGHHVVLTNREFAGCTTALWDVEVALGGEF